MKISKNLYSYLKLHEYELNNKEFDRLFSYVERYMNPTDSECFYRLIRKSVPNYLYYMSFIPDSFFEDDHSIEHIVIPDNIKRIGYAAFRSCRQLQTVTISNNVLHIPDCCFEYCDQLINVKLPDKVNSFGTCAFESCRSLTNLYVPKTLEDMYHDSFRKCYKLTIEYEGTSEDWVRKFGNLVLGIDGFTFLNK